MLKIKVTKNNIANCVASVLSLGLTIYALVMFIKSFYYYNGGSEGTEFGFDQDTIYLLLASIILLSINLYAVYNKENGYKELCSSFALFNGILTCNYLGTFLKQMLRDKPKPFADYKLHLIYGIITLVVCIALVVVYYIKFVRKNENK